MLQLGARVTRSLRLRCISSIRLHHHNLATVSVPQLNRETYPPDHPFFNYTSGRWLIHETAQLEKRCLKFDVQALKDVVMSTCPGASSVISMEKLPEGNFNKVLLVQLDNGREVVARLRNPNAGPVNLVTASEVATMEYARRKLGVPVPRVLGWCSNRNDTPVGAEYIIMEKAPGIEIFRIWPDLDHLQKIKLVRELVKIEGKLAAATFPAHGSLYFRDFAEAEGLPLVHEAVNDDFVVGPSVSPTFWDDERERMDVDRGPCEFEVSACKLEADVCDRESSR